MRNAIWPVVAVGLLLAAAPARAQQIVYEFADNTGAARTAFSVAPGDTVQVRVYIHELTSGAPTLNSDGGLGSGAVKVTFGNPAGVAAVQTAGDIAVGPAWAFGTGKVSPTSNPTSATLSNGSATNAGVLPDAQGRVLLGTFTFHGLTAGSVNLTAVDPNTAGYDTSSFATDTNFTPLINYDPLLGAGAATITVSAVPEPVTLTWVLLAAGGTALWRRRRVPANTPAS